MKEAKFEDIQEILRKAFGELYMYKNVYMYYNEDENDKFFKLEVKISDINENN